MPENRLLGSYRLALSLVPDEDAAGDIFMDASSDLDLIKRAGAWRVEHGLLSDVSSALLPELSPDQVEHALHLARRGKARRFARRVIRGAVGLVVAALAVLAFRAVAPVGLAADSSYTGPPAAASGVALGLRFSVYKADVSGRIVTVWYDLKGPGAGAMGKDLHPTLQLAGNSRWYGNYDVQVVAQRPDRAVGRATYRVVTGAAASATVRVAELGGQSVDWRLTVPIGRPQGAQAVVQVDVNQVVALGPAMVTVESVLAGPESTVVKYRGTLPADMTMPYPASIRSDSAMLRMVQPGTLPTGPGSHEVKFGPLRGGDAMITLYFAGASQRVGERVYDLPAAEVSALQRQGNTVSGTLSMPSGELVGGRAFLTDESGESFEVAWRGVITKDGKVRYNLNAFNVPTGVRLVSLTLSEVVHLFPGTSVNIDLNRL